MPDPRPKKKLPEDVRAIARRFSNASMNVLGGWATNDATDPEIRIRAIGMLLDRGWGKPAQPVTGEGGGDIRLTIRTIIESGKK